MKVTGVELSSESANIFKFGFSDVQSNDKYLIKHITGLDADDINRKFYGFGSASNSKFYRYGISKREVVMRVVLNPNYEINESYSEIRDELYRAISSSRTGSVNLMFVNGGAAVASLDGYITKFEVPYFSKIPELQITIATDYPLLRGFNPVEYEGPDLPTTNMMYISDALSTAPHGFSFELEFTTEISGFYIQDQQSNPEWAFGLSYTFLTGDVLTFSSELTDKKMYVTRSGIEYNLLDRVTPTSVWPVVFPGANEYYFAQMGTFDWISLSYYPTYWGI